MGYSFISNYVGLEAMLCILCTRNVKKKAVRPYSKQALATPIACIHPLDRRPLSPSTIPRVLYAVPKGTLKGTARIPGHSVSAETAYCTANAIAGYLL